MMNREMQMVAIPHLVLSHNIALISFMFYAIIT